MGSEMADGFQIPKPNAESGLQIGWPAQESEKEAQAKLLDEIKGRL